MKSNTHVEPTPLEPCGQKIVINEVVLECTLERGHQWAHMDRLAVLPTTWTDPYKGTALPGRS